MRVLRLVSKRTTPLCFLPDGRLVSYKRGRIVVLNNGEEDVGFSILTSRKEHLFGWSRIATRLLRFGIRSAVAIDNDNIIFSIGNYIYELSLATGKMSKGWFCGDGVRPLIMTDIKGINGIDNGIYFGGYVHNHEKKPVNIYHRLGMDNWEIVYTFPQDTINHVHNVVADPYRQCLWVFTGDFDDAAAIWKVTDNFNKVERIRCGSQKWRGSMVFVLPEGLLYATDTPRADDFLYLLNPDSVELKVIMPLDGSCIYGCKWNDKYVLSTTVESNGGEMSFFENWFGRKRGDGIKDEYVHMYCGNLDEGFREIYKEKKDWLPFTLFQFGAFKFPSGVNVSDTLYFQPAATTKNDQCLMAIDNKN